MTLLLEQCCIYPQHRQYKHLQMPLNKYLLDMLHIMLVGTLHMYLASMQNKKFDPLN
jgi:hypothetical protein